MALHFTASQFEDAYKPKRLRNWQVPKWYPPHPTACKGTTQIISNDKGHILPGVERSKKSPWGDFVDTWNLPRKITREIANQLSAPDPEKINAWKKRAENRKSQVKELDLKAKPITKLKPKPPEPEPEPEPEPAPPKQDEKPPVQGFRKPCGCICTCTCHAQGEGSKEDGADSEGNKQIQEGDAPADQTETKESEEDRKQKLYVPGDLTDEKHKHYTHDKLVTETLHKGHKIKTSQEGYPLYRDDFARKEEKQKSLKEQVDEMYEEHKKMCQHVRPERKAKKHSDPSAPFLAAAKNFQLAKKLHKENLEHEPLPDTITDALYRKIQMQKGSSEPGLILKDGNYATGVGWKGYPGYGATRCTKLKVYRPNTGVAIKGGYKVERPASVSSFDKKWRFIRQEKVSPIELAICWDLTPTNPSDEPKRPTHIDGSNGSQAPAVFSLVHTPKDEEVVVSARTPAGKVEITCNKLDVTSETNSSKTLSSCKECKKPERPKTAWTKKQDSTDSSSKLSSVKRAQSAYNLKEIEKPNGKSSSGKGSQTTSSTSLKDKKPMFRSTPNLSEYQMSYKFCSKDCYNKRYKNNRICVACELKNINLREKRPKTEFKMAFKAGVPQKTVSNPVCCRNITLQVPKQKDPYNKRNYAINTLAPPFSLQKDKRTDYPEHWRLASVYQHSYKPVHTRKRPLLATVYQ